MPPAPLILTPGDPLGVGPEISVAAMRLHPGAVLAGDPGAIRRLAPVELVPPDRLGAWIAAQPPGPPDPARPLPVLDLPPGGEPVEIRALRLAVDLCRAGRARALVTGPIHKARLHAQGFRHSGHTDFLGDLCGVPEPVMAFTGEDHRGRPLRAALVTVHVPLARVPALIRRDRVLRTLRQCHAALRDHLCLPAPRLAVCGLNPHAGESGVLGQEEIEEIAPACADARAEGIAATDPISAETAFLEADQADMIVAMYHDQALVPLKALGFGRCVNWTLGLPIVRTSVDHGTADALVGTGRARPDSLLAALRLADQLTATPGPG